MDWKLFERPGAWDGVGQFPVGNGNDFSGVVEQIGPGVSQWAVGDAVFGGYPRGAQATLLVFAADRLLPKPEGLTWEQAGSMDISGRTAVASVRAVGVRSGETVLVSAAAGGVGILVAQLALLAGARVIGTASEHNHDYLRSLGIEPISYGAGLLQRIRALAPEGISAVLDNSGTETIDVAVALGVDPQRINTVAERDYAVRMGVQTVGMYGADLADLRGIGEQVALGRINYPIQASYPLEEVRSAYETLRGGHVRGKVVLFPTLS
jgi:NADPH:quinone reductase-like Zn-dependent oxidoreductase